MTRKQAELLYQACRWKRNSYRLHIPKWESISDHELERRAMMRIWIEAMETVALEVLTAPEPQDYGFMSESDYVAQIERDGFVRGTVLA